MSLLTVLVLMTAPSRSIQCVDPGQWVVLDSPDGMAVVANWRVEEDCMADQQNPDG